MGISTIFTSLTTPPYDHTNSAYTRLVRVPIFIKDTDP